MISVDHVENCPICGHILSVAQSAGWIQSMKISDQLKVFFCLNTLANGPFHYYNHMVNRYDQKFILFQEFSLELNNKITLVSIDYFNNETSIRNINTKQSYILNTSFVPDFPLLQSIEKRLKTLLLFS